MVIAATADTSGEAPSLKNLFDFPGRVRGKVPPRGVVCETVHVPGTGQDAKHQYSGTEGAGRRRRRQIKEKN